MSGSKGGAAIPAPHWNVIMRNQVSQVLLVALLVSLAYIAGRSRSIPEVPHLASQIHPLAHFLSDRRLDVDLHGVPLEKAITLLAEMYGAPLAGGWESLERAGADRAALVSLRGTQLNLHEALQRLRLDDDAAPLLGYFIQGDRLLVTTEEDAASRGVTVVYPLRPILEKLFGEDLPHDFPIATRGRPRAVWVGSPTARRLKQPNSPGMSYEEAVEIVEELICRCVEQETWFVDVVRYGTLREANGLLIVTHHPYGQTQVARFLNTLTRSTLMPTTRPAAKDGLE